MNNHQTNPAQRATRIAPFYVMEILERAQQAEAAGRDVIHLEVGEPEFQAPQPIRDALVDAVGQGRCRYTHSKGLPGLRAAIADRYRADGIAVDPEQIIVSSGTSPLLVVVLATILDPGDQVLVLDPGYPCYPNDLTLLGCQAIPVPARPENGFRPDIADVRAAITPQTRAIIVNSPANPTGVVLSATELAELADLDVWLVVDEIYRGLEYGGQQVASALSLGRDNVIVVDGFSKRYAMTGFRLGYCVLPSRLAQPAQYLNQNTMISAAEFVQLAGIVALTDPAVQTDLDRQLHQLDRQRTVLLDGLRRLSIDVPAPPQGAFYLLADFRWADRPSLDLAVDILDTVGLAVAPGIDFGQQSEGFLRFSFAKDSAIIDQGIDRLDRWLLDTRQ